MTKEVRHRSVSQYNQYSLCPYSYWLARIERVWSRPAAWLPQGTALHEVLDQVAKSKGSMTLEDAQALFAREYDKDIGEMCKDTPNVQFWSRSGPYGGKVDIERRFKLGLEQIEKWFRWNEKHPEERFWTTPNGEIGSEIAFDIDLDGVPVKGFIDAVLDVVEDDDPEECSTALRVRDYKTGKAPSDDFQLGVYRVALQLMFGVDVMEGDFWLGKSGKATFPYDLSDWTVERVTEMFHDLEANIQAENFEPDPEPSKCRFCDVSASCQFSMG
ncbi:Cas4 exonuclease [Mycobacterium phage Cuco]|uniref:Cas4 exonuclease n=1 Tax=Mycobacterium phage Cuco TaxID=2922992 RepID=G1JUP1_9CAUD|nr:exonuclease [Mycobacterium phage Cuco]AVR76646.1 Cas4 exonuclease [Mycobacterium phage Coog]AVR77191.1 Cas4 exonuclease [Mycobacterium phage Midas2]AXC33341.1 Cas4 exonuclease [Mycobacterium phage Dublin]QGJ92241.1 Cas4 exonuclease [Mycobacterium phage MarysWell]AEL17700.1 Cas4 exonuclease [Mycobacterium phage Cuco]